MWLQVSWPSHNPTQRCWWLPLCPASTSPPGEHISPYGCHCSWRETLLWHLNDHNRIEQCQQYKVGTNCSPRGNGHPCPVSEIKAWSLHPSRSSFTRKTQTRHDCPHWTGDEPLRAHCVLAGQSAFHFEAGSDWIEVIFSVEVRQSGVGTTRWVS